MSLKICNRCREWKDVGLFSKSRSTRDGLQYKCKKCDKERLNIAHLADPAKRRASYARWISKNASVKAASRKDYNQRTKSDRVAYAKKYKQEHKDELKTKRSIRDKARRKRDVHFRIQNNLRGRTWYALKRGGSKVASAIELVGCTMEFLRTHLEAQFTKGMTWENHARDGWHIDHIKPCCAFDLTDPEQQKACFHYSNLRPLWGKENCAANQYHARTKG